MSDLSVGEKSFDDVYFENVAEEEEISPYDRVVLYAKEIQKRGKILVYLDTDSDSYHFCFIEDREEVKQEFHQLANIMIEIGGDYFLYCV